MKKTIAMVVMLLLMLGCVPMALAQSEELSQIDVSGFKGGESPETMNWFQKILNSIDFQAFTFANAPAGNRVDCKLRTSGAVLLYQAGTKNNIAGKTCNVGDFVVFKYCKVDPTKPFPAGAYTCINIFEDLWYKSSSSDLINFDQYKLNWVSDASLHITPVNFFFKEECWSCVVDSPIVCQSDRTYCEGTTSYKICQADGKTFSDLQACGSGSSCQNGVCIASSPCGTMKAGEFKCTGTTTYDYCKSTGIAKLTCASGSQCVSGEGCVPTKTTTTTTTTVPKTTTTTTLTPPTTTTTYGTTKFSDVSVSPKTVTLGQTYVINGLILISSADASKGMVLETGFDMYGKPSTATTVFTVGTLSASQTGACGDDKTVGVKFDASGSSKFEFNLRDKATEVGKFDVPVYLFNHCSGVGGEDAKVLAQTTVTINVIEAVPEPEEEIATTKEVKCEYCVDSVLKTSVYADSCPIGTYPAGSGLNCAPAQNTDTNTPASGSTSITGLVTCEVGQSCASAEIGTTTKEPTDNTIIYIAVGAVLGLTLLMGYLLFGGKRRRL